MIQSFIIYTLFALALYFCARGVSRTQVQLIEMKGKFFFMPSNYWWCIFIFALVAGMRYDVGVDHLSYLKDYIRALDGVFFVRDRGIEYGYLLFTQSCGALGVHPTIYFGIIAAIQLTLFLWPYRRENSIIPYMMFLLILGGLFFYWMNAVRQAVAACIFVFSIPFIQRRKPILFFFSIFIAFLWHQSALILLPFYLLTYDKSIWGNRLFLFSASIICFILGNNLFWLNRLLSLQQILQIIGYDHYLNNFDQIINISRTYTFGPRMIVMFLQHLIIIYFYPKCRTYYSSSLIDFNFKLFFIGICGYYLFVNTNLYFLRPIEYFTMFTLPLLAYTLVYLKRKRPIFFLLLLISSASYTYLCCLSDANAIKNERQSYLYHFYFMETNSY